MRLFLFLMLLLPSAAAVNAEQGNNAVIVTDANQRSSPSETARIITPPLAKDTKVVPGRSEQLDKIENEMISHVITEIRSISEPYAREKGFTQVLNKNSGSVFYTDPRFDITRDIIREYDQRISLQQPEP